jgi:hypothetical protein
MYIILYYPFINHAIDFFSPRNGHWIVLNNKIQVFFFKSIYIFKRKNVITLVLGSQPKQGVARCGARGKPENHISCSWECKRVWRNEPSHSQMNSHLKNWSPKWIIKFLKSNCRGQNSIDWDIPYIIEKILERKCLKWACMMHLNIWNTSYGQKKGRESNWKFDSQPLKVRNCPDFLAYMWLATYHWKAFDEGYYFASNVITIKGLHG